MTTWMKDCSSVTLCCTGTPPLFPSASSSLPLRRPGTSGESTGAIIHHCVQDPVIIFPHISVYSFLGNGYDANVGFIAKQAAMRGRIIFVMVGWKSIYVETISVSTRSMSVVKRGVLWASLDWKWERIWDLGCFSWRTCLPWWSR